MMHKPLLKSTLVFFIACTSLACSSDRHESAATAQLSRQEMIRYEQYLVQGESLYQTHCANCHQQDGSGLRRLIPPLAQADYMLANVPRTLCLIKYGAVEEMIVNGTSYHQKMPAFEQLTAIEITQIANYIYNSWGNEYGLIPLRDVSASLRACQP